MLDLPDLIIQFKFIMIFQFWINFYKINSFIQLVFKSFSVKIILTLAHFHSV